MLIILFSVRLGIFPVSGYGETLGEKLAHLVLPSLTVALSLSTVLTRSLRAAMVAGAGVRRRDRRARPRHAGEHRVLAPCAAEFAGADRSTCSPSTSAG